jgi:hypothetical protein
MIIAVAHGIPDPKSHHLLFELVAMASGLMIVIHTYGAIRKTQPLSETVEILAWAMAFVGSVWIRWWVLS